VTDLINNLQRIKNEDKDIAYIMDSFAEIDKAYQEALVAMGSTNEQELDVCNSAEVTISFHGSSIYS
jgi:hypothetical protein